MLTEQEAATIKGMLARGDKQHDIAAVFGVNGGRIAEIAKGYRFADVDPAEPRLHVEVLDEQVLDRMTARAEMAGMPIAHVFEVTPGFARWVLHTRHRGNRHPKNGKVLKEYAPDMANGRWALNGEALKFDQDGYLCDGQNRLKACLHAKTSFVTFVVFGVERRHFETMDQGKLRGSADLLTIEGCGEATKTAAMLRWVAILESPHPEDRGVTYPPQQILAFYRQRGGYAPLRPSIVVANRLYDVYRHPIGQVAALHYVFTKVDAEKAREFFELWTTGSRRLEKLQLRLNQLKAGHDIVIPEPVRIGLIIQAWNMFRSGKRVTDSGLNYTMGDKFEKWS